MIERIQGLTYKQILLVKGTSFSLLLLASNHLFDSSLIYLAVYMSMFVIRYIFSYNLENYKFKLIPLWHFTDPSGDEDSLKKLTDEDSLLFYGTEKGTEVFKLKTSTSYVFGLYFSSIVSCISVFIYYLNYLFSVVDYIFHLLGYVDRFIMSAGFISFIKVIVVILLVIGLADLVKVQLKLKRATVKDQLKE